MSQMFRKFRKDRRKLPVSYALHSSVSVWPLFWDCIFTDYSFQLQRNSFTRVGRRNFTTRNSSSRCQTSTSFAENFPSSLSRVFLVSKYFRLPTGSSSHSYCTSLTLSLFPSLPSSRSSSLFRRLFETFLLLYFTKALMRKALLPKRKTQTTNLLRSESLVRLLLLESSNPLVSYLPVRRPIHLWQYRC